MSGKLMKSRWPRNRSLWEPRDRSIGSVRTGGRDRNAYNPHDTWLLWRGREREMKLVSINGAFTLRFQPLIEE